MPKITGQLMVPGAYNPLSPAVDALIETMEARYNGVSVDELGNFGTHITGQAPSASSTIPSAPKGIMLGGGSGADPMAGKGPM